MRDYGKVHTSFWISDGMRRVSDDARLLALYLLTYPVGRFLLEFFRGDERLHWLHLDVAQEISIALFAIGAVLWFVLRAKARKANG